MNNNYFEISLCISKSLSVNKQEMSGESIITSKVILIYSSWNVCDNLCEPMSLVARDVIVLTVMDNFDI